MLGRSVMRRYAVALLAVAFAYLIEVVLRSFGTPTPRLIAIGAVAFAVWYGGGGPGLFSIVMSAIMLLVEDITMRGTLDRAAIGLLVVYLAIAALVLSLNMRRLVATTADPVPSRPEIIHLADYLREKRRNDAGIPAADRRGPLVIAHDLRAHYELAHLTATELKRHIGTSDEAQQVFAYLQWAHEQIEHDIACLRQTLRSSSQEERSAITEE